MKWFKHICSLGTHDSILSAIQDRHGLEGVARYYLLLEVVTFKMETVTDSPSAQLSVARWRGLLHCKGKALRTFLNDLQEIGICKFYGNDHELTIELPKLPDLLDSRAVSSRIRKSAGHPRGESISGEQEERKFEDEESTRIGAAEPRQSSSSLIQEIWEYTERTAPDLSENGRHIAVTYLYCLGWGRISIHRPAPNSTWWEDFESTARLCEENGYRPNDFVNTLFCAYAEQFDLDKPKPPKPRQLHCESATGMYTNHKASELEDTQWYSSKDDRPYLPSVSKVLKVNGLHHA